MINRNNRTGKIASSPLHQLHRASQLAGDLFSEEMRSIDLTPRQFAVLQVVGSREGLSQTDLVEETGIDRSTIADIVRRMQRKGLLKRRRTKSDARVYAVSLTDKSKKLMQKAGPAARRADERLLAPLSPAERGRLDKYLTRIANRDG